MAAKKKKTDAEQETKPTFDWKTALQEIECSNMLKAGFGYYIEINNITINSEKELEKEFNKFKNGNAGV